MAKTAEQAPSDVRAVKAAAVARAVARKREPNYKIIPGAGLRGRDLRIDLNADLPELLPPTTTAEWCDVQISKLPLCEPYNVAVRIMDEMRSGQAAAVSAVRLAEQLGPWNQHALWTYLDGLLPPSPPAEAAAPLSAVRGEWRRRGLATTQAEADQQKIPMPVGNQADLDASAARVRTNAPPIPAGRL